MKRKQFGRTICEKNNCSGNESMSNCFFGVTSSRILLILINTHIFNHNLSIHGNKIHHCLRCPLSNLHIKVLIVINVYINKHEFFYHHNINLLESKFIIFYVFSIDTFFSEFSQTLTFSSCRSNYFNLHLSMQATQIKMITMSLPIRIKPTLGVYITKLYLYPFCLHF